MGEELADRYPLLAGAPELGKVALYGLVECQLPLVHQQHARGREPHDLRERREIVDRARVDGARVVRSVPSDGGEQREPPMASDCQHRTGKRAALRFRLHVDGGRGEPRAVEPEGAGRGGRNGGARRQRDGGAAGGDEPDERNERARTHGCAVGIVTPNPMG